jgi:hypothetical protein
MTIHASMDADEARRGADAQRPPLIQPAPADDAPEARHKLSPARGLILGLAICAVFWLAVMVVVALLRS